MKKIVRVLLLLTVVIVGIGFYRGWFTVTGSRESQSNNMDVRLSVDADKVRQDADTITEGSKPQDPQDSHREP